MTHDYKRHSVTTLFATLNVEDGTVLGRCTAQHRHQEFVRCLNAIERAIPPGKLIHAIADNYATHRSSKVRAWLERHPRWVFHFTPTSASWINAVEGFFSTLTRQHLRRGLFYSVVDLDQAIARTIREHNAGSKLFVWTKPADTILGKLGHMPAFSVWVSAVALAQDGEAGNAQHARHAAVQVGDLGLDVGQAVEQGLRALEQALPCVGEHQGACRLGKEQRAQWRLEPVDRRTTEEGVVTRWRPTAGKLSLLTTSTKTARCSANFGPSILAFPAQAFAEREA